MDWLVEVEVECAHCGELFPVTVDTSQGDYETTDDCALEDLWSDAPRRPLPDTAGAMAL